MADPQDQQQQKPPTAQTVQYKEQIPEGWEASTPEPTAKPAHPVPSSDWQPHTEQTHMPANTGDTIPKNYGFTFGNMYSNGIRAVGELGTGLWNTGKEILNTPLSPEQQKQGEVGKEVSRWKNMGNDMVVKPAQEEERKAAAALNDPDPNRSWLSKQTESFGHGLAAAIPVVGPWAANIGEQAGTGDVGGALTRGAVQYGAAELAPRVPSLVKKAGDNMLRAVGKGIAENTPKTAPIARPEEAFDENDLINPDTARKYGEYGIQPPEGMSVVVDGKKVPFDDWLKSQPTPSVRVVDPKAPTEAPPTSTQMNADATQTIRDHGIAQYNDTYAPSGNGIRAVSRTFDVTPEGVREAQPPVSSAEVDQLANDEIAKHKAQNGNGNGSMVQREAPKPADAAEVDKLASDEVDKAEPKDSPAQVEARRMMRHRVPEELQDRLVRDNPDVGARLVKGTNANYADIANQLNMPGAKGDTWTAADFSRGGSEMSEKKAMVMRHLVENYPPEDILDMTGSWGAKQTPPGVGASKQFRRNFGNR